jgi:endoribonuclease Dicer
MEKPYYKPRVFYYGFKPYQGDYNYSNYSNYKEEYNACRSLIHEKTQKNLYKIDHPREYQRTIFEEVKDRNAIVFMETGKGKTYISVMLMNYLFGKQKGKKVIFLVCEGSLVEQQYMVIKNNTRMRIKQFIGGKMTGLLSDPKIFRKVWEDNDIFISTPQIVNKILTIGYLTFTEIDLLIFDECHHTDKDHPYNLLMTEFYFFYKIKHKDVKLPQILGLTASPLKKKIESDVENSANESLTNLAENLDCEFIIDPELYALNESNGIEQCSPTNREAQKEFIEVKCHLDGEEFEDIGTHLYKNLFSKLVDLCFEHNSEYLDYKEQYKSYVKAKLSSQDLMDFNQILCKFKFLYEFRKFSFLFLVLEQIQRQIFMLLENVNFEAINDLVTQYYQLYENNKKDLVRSCSKKQYSDMEMDSLLKLIDILRGFILQKKIKYESNRLRELLKRVTAIVEEDVKKGDKDPNYEGHRIIIFVCNRVVSDYLCKLINKYLNDQVNNMMNYKKFLCVNVVGINSKSTKNTFVSKNTIANLNKNLEKFKRGEAQILIGTSTIEEGLDVKQCDVVMVYTDLRTAKSYIQMKGRARKENAKFVMFTHNIERTQQYIGEFVNLITVMRQAFKDGIVGKFKREGYLEHRDLTYPYMYLEKTQSKLTLKNVAVIFNETKAQFISRKKYFHFKIEYEAETINKQPCYKAFMYVEQSDDIPKCLYKRPFDSEYYLDKTSAANHCMLYFLALCHKRGIIDDHFRLR